MNPPLKGNNEAGCGHYRDPVSFNTAGKMNFILLWLGGNDLLSDVKHTGNLRKGFLFFCLVRDL